MEITLYTLIALLIGTNSYWAWVCLQLTNRLMSRNFGEYAQAVKRPVKLVEKPEDMSDPLAERHAKEANAMMGVV